LIIMHHYHYRHQLMILRRRQQQQQQQCHFFSRFVLPSLALKSISLTLFYFLSLTSPFFFFFSVVYKVQKNID
jgi:hypothetical protein